MLLHLLNRFSCGLPIAEHGLFINSKRCIHMTAGHMFKKGNFTKVTDDDKEPNLKEGHENERTRDLISEANKTFSLPFDTKTAPEVMGRTFYSDIDRFRRRSYKGVVLEAISQIEQERPVGAEAQFFSISIPMIDHRLPTMATMDQLFDGIPYKKLPIVYISAKYNNTIVGMTQPEELIHWQVTTAGREGFKNAKKKTTLAGQSVGASAANKLKKMGIKTVRVVIKGIGPGRMSSVKALTSHGIHVVSISDRTRLPELGPRPRKIRRV